MLFFLLILKKISTTLFALKKLLNASWKNLFQNDILSFLRCREPICDLEELTNLRLQTEQQDEEIATLKAQVKQLEEILVAEGIRVEVAGEHKNSAEQCTD